MKRGTKRWTYMVGAVLLSAAVLGAGALEAGENKTDGEDAKVVSDGSEVKVHYTLTVEGREVDSSRGGEPLDVTMGRHQVIPGFEKGLMGMKVGEKKTIAVSPEDGYGVADDKAFVSVGRGSIPDDIKVEPGMTLYAQSAEGQRMPVRVEEVKEDTVLLNFNHPLAGKTLNFDIEVVEVQ
jgi:FKBP-type peptidyl-prolyl cis-trans isomerase 2